MHANAAISPYHDSQWQFIFVCFSEKRLLYPYFIRYNIPQYLFVLLRIISLFYVENYVEILLLIFQYFCTTDSHTYSYTHIGLQSEIHEYILMVSMLPLNFGEKTYMLVDIFWLRPWRSDFYNTQGFFRIFFNLLCLIIDLSVYGVYLTSTGLLYGGKFLWLSTPSDIQYWQVTPLVFLIFFLLLIIFHAFHISISSLIGPLGSKNRWSIRIFPL